MMYINIKLILKKKGEEYDEIRRCFGCNILFYIFVCYFVKYNFLEFKGYLYIYFIGCLCLI